MKFFKILSFFLFTISLFSCSSDSSSDSSEPTDTFFNLTYNGQVKTIDHWMAIKQEDFIEVTAKTPDGLGISFKFNTHGNLFESYIHPSTTESTIPLQSTFAYNSSNTFIFELVHLNTTKNIIEVNFIGRVYDNKYDHTSSYSFINGSFKIPYTNQTPNVSGMGTYAKIMNQDWYGKQKSAFGDGETTTLRIQNETGYIIDIVYPFNNPSTGRFNFSDNSALTRISISKYDAATHRLMEYYVSGTVTYTAASTIVEGRFSLSATHPTDGSTIYITNGTFKEAAM